MSHYYRYGEKSDYRRVRADVVVALVIILAVVVLAVFLFFDLRTEVVVNDENNRPQVLNVVDVEEETTVITKEDFRITLPGGWEEAKPDHQSTRGTSGTKQWHFRSIDPGEEGKVFDVFVDNLPKDEPVSKLLPVTVEGDKIIPGDISDQCKTFTKHDAYGRKLEAIWQNHSFQCDTSSYANTIGIASGGGHMNEGIVLEGPDGQDHTFMIIFTDHSRAPSNTTFKNILEDFEVL